MTEHASRLAALADQRADAVAAARQAAGHPAGITDPEVLARVAGIVTADTTTRAAAS